MNIIRVMKKEFLQNIRDYRMIFIMTLFPIILIYLVGTTFGGSFTDDVFGLEQVKVDVIIAQETDETLEMYNLIRSELNDTLNISEELKLVEDSEQGLYRLSKNLTDMLIVIEDDTINLHRNSRYYKQFTVIESIIRSIIVTDYNGMVQLHNISLKNQTTIGIIKNNDYFDVKDYFALAFIVMFIMYGVFNSITNMIREKKLDNTNRILLSPIKKIELILGKILAYVLVNIIQISIVFISTIIFFGMNWGDNYLAVIVLLVSLIIMVVSFGNMLGFLFSTEGAVVGLIHTLIALLAFFSGCYMPLSGLGNMGEIGKYFSPAWWVIEGGLDLIYLGSYEVSSIAILINMIAAAVFVLITWLFVSKKEVLR